jgi:uncharacterized membrane protein YhfC
MNVVWDPIYSVNLVLCAVILGLGIVDWRRSRKRFTLYVGIAFGLFGLSHLATILGLKDSLETALIIVRTLAYVLVAFALYQAAFRAK